MLERLKSLSIKLKISAAFAIILLLLLSVSTISYKAITSSSSGFSDYREMARDTNLAGRVQANMLMVRMNVKDFIITNSKKDIEQYKSYYKKTKGFMDKAKDEIQKSNRANTIASVDKKLNEYNVAFDKVISLAKQRALIVNDVLNKDGKSLEKILSKILYSASKDNDMKAAFNAGVAMRHLLLARLYVTKFLDTNDKGSVNRVTKEFNSLKKVVNTLDRELQNRKRRALLKSFHDKLPIYQKGFKDLVKTIYDRNDVIKNKLDKIGPVIAKKIEEVKLDIKSVQDKIGPSLKESNKSAESLILIVSLLSIGIGLIIAFLFSTVISKTISELARKLKSVSENVLISGNNLYENSNQLKDSSIDQENALKQVTTVSTEISKMVESNSKSVSETLNLSEKCSKDASNGKKSVEEVKLAIDAIHLNNEELVKNFNKSNSELQEIVEVINEISEKTQVINDIVFQTKLLSFNASVEAARAGEHGKGFSVVAEEVGNLAQMSGDAATEITELVTQSSDKVENIVKSSKESITRVIDEAKVRVDVGLGKTQECHEILNSITSGFHEVKESVQSIATSSVDQEDGVRGITSSVHDIKSISEKTNVSVEDTGKESERLKTFSGELSVFVNEMNIFVNGK